MEQNSCFDTEIIDILQKIGEKERNDKQYYFDLRDKVVKAYDDFKKGKYYNSSIVFDTYIVMNMEKLSKQELINSISYCRDEIKKGGNIHREVVLWYVAEILLETKS